MMNLTLLGRCFPASSRSPFGGGCGTTSGTGAGSLSWNCQCFHSLFCGGFHLTPRFVVRIIIAEVDFTQPWPKTPKTSTLLGLLGGHRRKSSRSCGGLRHGPGLIVVYLGMVRLSDGKPRVEPKQSELEQQRREEKRRREEEEGVEMSLLVISLLNLM